MTDVSKDDFKKVMASFAASVTVVTTIGDDAKLVGLTATAFSSLSMDPPLCLVCVDKRGASHEAIATNRRFAVNVLAADQTELSNRFASRREDKFDGVAHSPGAVTGCPLLDGAIATMECELHEILPGGDHSIFVGRLVATSTKEGNPLLYFRGGYRNLASP
ncbi:MAG: flavin reductase family protein [Deltaproteobacteria bacterium]|nr:flavin reductase family protein [Deltaproteobacteria bacterium]